ncbi:Ig-like domain-containing protein [Bradyrhizobium sp. USDA 313]|uniref:Ig-like domain-containing protein n=1 Tax=Bradyrhizobium sp. USDA 313 TaxID=3156307 RepID=UPI003518775B
MALNDGSLNASTGAPQLPNLLDGYAVRPSWEVAGVDYAVGVPADTQLKDWQTLSGPGITVSGNMVRIDGQAGVHLDGIDFSTNGGAFVYLTNSPDAVITNCKFQATTPTSLIDAGPGSPNLTVEHCTLIGGADGSALISGSGNVVVQYNWMKDFPQHAVEIGGSTDLTYKYNLIENGGTVAGSHLNYLQQTGTGVTNKIDIEFNTSYETPSAASGEGYQFDINDGSNSGTLVDPIFAYNTMISTGDTAMSYMVHGSSMYASSNPAVTPISGTALAHDNFLDTSGAYGAFYPGSMDGWSLSNNVDMRSGKVISADNTLSGTASTSAPPTATPPAAPIIASFSIDSGVAGDGVTNDNALELKGAAAAGSTVKIYDGSTQIGTTTASSTGSWDYITKVLTDAKHTLTATATDSSGQTSVASAAKVVTIDTKAPAAPTIASDTVNSANQVVVTGTAEANSAIKVYDGTTQVGTATTNSSGAWSVTTSALSSGSHLLTAKATDVAGNVSAASTAVDPVIGSGTTGSTGSGTSGSGTSGTGTSGSGTSGSDTSGTGTSGSGTSGSGTSGTGTSGTGTSAPAAPKIATFSKDTGVAGDHITSDNTLTLTGTAAANSTVKVFDGKTQLGTVTADAKGAWHYSTAALPDGKHSFIATDTVSGVTSKASTALDVTVDTAAPDAPVLLSDSTTHNRATVSGTAEAGSLIKLYEGTNLLGTATVASDGGWSVTTPNLKQGSHTFTATATDAADNTSALSQPIDPPIGPHSGGGTSTVEVTNVQHHWGHTATIKGTADPNSAIKLFDGTTSVGSVTTGADGKWSFKTSDLSGKSHAFSAEQVDTTGHVVGTSSGEAIVGSGRSDTLTGTKGNDIMVGKWGADTFQFASNFGHDVIKDFAARGPAHDTIEFSKSVFDSFASVLSHAAQSGHDVVIATGSDTLTLKNTQLDKLNSHDFHFA